MLHKEYCFNGPFPYMLKDGYLLLLKEKRVPVSYDSVLLTDAVTRVKPGLKYPINFFSVTHVKGKEEPKPGQEHSHLRLVAMSDGKDTRYYYYGKKTRATYLANMPSKTHEEAWLNLLKAVIMDDRDRGIAFYNLVKHFFVEYFKTRGDEPFQVSLSGRWKDMLLHVDFERMPLLAPSSIFININGREQFASLHTHPLVELVG